MPVEIAPDDTAERIRRYLRANPELVYDEYQDGDLFSLNGACYVAAEAYFHAKGGTDSGLDIYCLSWSDVDPDYDGTHWYLKRDDTWVDLALDDPEQADTIPFEAGTRRAFITGYEPSNRTKSVLSALNIAI